VISSRLRDRVSAGHVNIHDDGCNIENPSSRDFGVLLDSIVTNTTREFHYPVMDFDANGVGDDILFSIELGENIVLNLPIAFHQVFPSWLIRGSVAVWKSYQRNTKSG
jgi:hypothetical protein